MPCSCSSASHSSSPVTLTSLYSGRRTSVPPPLRPAASGGRQAQTVPENVQQCPLLRLSERGKVELRGRPAGVRGVREQSQLHVQLLVCRIRIRVRPDGSRYAPDAVPRLLP